MHKHDIVIIGTGAGLMVLEEALNEGLDCAIVEKAKFGGTCLTKGCIPSKMLVYPADLIREIEGAGRVGVLSGDPRIDWETVSRRMWNQINFNAEIERNLKSIPNLTVYKGTGAFTGPRSMAVHYTDARPDDLIRAKRFVIAAGARSFIPPVEGLEEAGYVTSETFFGEKYPQKPWKSLAIIGGGVISAEFAHIFSAFGTKVTILERSGRILNKEEPEISAFVTKQFESNGIDVLTNTSIVSVCKDNGMKRLTLETGAEKGRSTLVCEEILVASGIRSNADILSVEKAGVAVDARGWIVTNPYLETSKKGIWALGDINGKYQFRHKANYEAQILIDNLFHGGKKRAVSYASVPWAIFSHPQVAHVGMTEEELRRNGIEYRVAANHYSEVVGGRAMGYREEDGDDGFVKVIVGSSNKKILGVHIAGPHAAILLQPFVYLMNAGYECRMKLQRAVSANAIEGIKILCPHIGTYSPISDSMVIHPSLNELTAWVFEKFDAEQ